MENYQGDLTDIVRGSRTMTTTMTTTTANFGCIKEDPFSFCSSASCSQLLLQQHELGASSSSSSRDEGQELNSFGDPFCAAIKDPLFQELDLICATNSSSSFFNTTQHEVMIKAQPSCNIFSRMLHISPPNHSPLLDIIPNPNNINSNSNPLIHPTFVDSTLQISSPRNSPAGIKRRKSQGRKVVCVPAPVGAASSRPNGEVIPSDLWAWRKYGQKPIKGSPYPRGYYRCSSSKGCSARKQVERSRTDPNMLVITYTSEHNHPWPTQRNALAGSSRSSQQSKNNNNNSNHNSSKLSTTPTQQGSDKNKQHPNTTSNHVKEEAVEEVEIENKQVEVEHQGNQFNEGFQYRVPMGSHNNNQSEDFFADLEELHSDPLNLLFTHVQKLDQCKGSAGLDDVVAFDNLFDDWAPENSDNNNSNNSFEEPPPSATKRGFY